MNRGVEKQELTKKKRQKQIWEGGGEKEKPQSKKNTLDAPRRLQGGTSNCDRGAKVGCA